MTKIEAVQTALMTLTMKTLSVHVMKHHSRNFLNSCVAPRSSGPNVVLVKQPQYILSVKTGMWSFTQQVQLYKLFCYFEEMLAWRLARSREKWRSVNKESRRREIS